LDENILTLVKRIEKHEIVLPDIQRSFVWDEDQIYDLFDSLVRGYPIGSLLFWKAIGSDEEERLLLYHEFVRYYRKDPRLPASIQLHARDEKTFVLDGQQRLQSLYLGLDGTYDGRELYVDLRGGTSSEDLDKNIAYYVRFLRSRSDLKDSNRFMVRLKDFIFLPPERFDIYRQKLMEESGLATGSDAWWKACRVMSHVREKLLQLEVIPIVTIDAHVRSAAECKSLDEVVEIFVRANDGGTKLSRMDLIFSLIKSRWTDASEAVEGLCQALNSTRDFAVTKDFVIRSLMVFSGRYSAQFRVDQMRKSDLMNEFGDMFPRAAASLRSAFDFLTQNRGAGITTWRLLSGGQRADRGYNVLIPIALYLYRRPAPDIPEREYRRMRRFLYTAIISRYPVVYVENRIDKLAQVFRDAFRQEPDVFPVNQLIAVMAEAEHFSSLEELIGRPHTLDPLLNIFNGGGVDFVTLCNRNAPQRDHIFPEAKLRARNVPDDKINHFANMRLLGKLPNILKSDIDPNDALANYTADALATDFMIPKHLLSYDKYDEFLEARARMIYARIQQYLADSQEIPVGP
jgi:Protein of unknown function DUF262